MLHADADFSIAVEGAVEAHDVRGIALMEHLQLSNDLVPDGGFDLQVDQLQQETPGFIEHLYRVHVCASEQPVSSKGLFFLVFN